MKGLIQSEASWSVSEDGRIHTQSGGHFLNFVIHDKHKEPSVSGFVKWDGCINFNTNPSCATHFCGLEDLRQFADDIIRVAKIAHIMIGGPQGEIKQAWRDKRGDGERLDWLIKYVANGGGTKFDRAMIDTRIEKSIEDEKAKSLAGRIIDGYIIIEATSLDVAKEAIAFAKARGVSESSRSYSERFPDGSLKITDSATVQKYPNIKPE